MNHTRGSHADDFNDIEPCYCDEPKKPDHKQLITEWVYKNYRRNAQPLWAWVDVADLLEFIKSLK